MEWVQIEYNEKIKPNKEWEELIKKVIATCFEVENLEKKHLYMNIVLTTPEEIRVLNREYRQIDKETDVLSFPMFEAGEIEKIELVEGTYDILGDVVISIEQVQKQAKEYGHSFERELSYMLVHGFYHLMGYDHIKEEDKKQMRPKEEYILERLKIGRE